MTRLTVKRLGVLLAGPLFVMGCTTAPKETAQDFLGRGDAMPLGQAEMEAQLAGALVEIEGRPLKRLWHGRDGSVADIGRPEGSDFSTGRWYFRWPTKYCRDMYAGPGSAGGCGTFYRRDGRIYLVTDGTGTRRHLWALTITKRPKPEPVMAK